MTAMIIAAMVMIMVMTMVMVVVVVVVVIMIMAMLMRVIMAVMLVVMMQPLTQPRAARVFAEDERLDRHRHGVGRVADAAQVDVVEIPQHHTIDHQELAPDPQLVAQDVAERLGDVAVEHDIE